MIHSSVTQKLTETLKVRRPKCTCSFTFFDFVCFYFIFPECLALILFHSSTTSSLQYYNTLPLKFNLAI